MSFSRDFLNESVDIIRRIDDAAIERMAAALAEVREGGGRLFIIGVGGSAGHASHAVNDFRKICQFEAYTLFSVGGGNVEKNVSVNLVRAIDEGRSRGARIFGIVGKDGGYTKKVAEECIVIPTASPDRITPHTEGLCAVIWHLLVSHPALKVAQTKWESVAR